MCSNMSASVSCCQVGRSFQSATNLETDEALLELATVRSVYYRRPNQFEVAGELSPS
jgi:hypothetical protein